MVDNRNRFGFTLIELLVATTIVSILSAAGFVSFVSANRNARNGKRQADLEQVRAGLELYRSDNATYPATNNWEVMITALDTYLTTASVDDPKNVSPYVYTYTDASGAGRSYVVCASLEPSSTAYCLNSP